MIFSIGMFNSDQLIDMTGSQERVLLSRRDHDLPKLLPKLRNTICREIETCEIISFQCLKRYSFGGYPSSVITNCQRTKCDDYNCLTRPCKLTETCLAKNEYDHICIDGVVKPPKGKLI